MKTLNRRAIALAVCLSALAGCVDAIGFLQLGGYFISFMSGNSTQMMVGLVAGQWLRVAQLAGILALFVTGTMAGTFAGHTGRMTRRGLRVLILVTGLLSAAAFSQIMGYSGVAIVFMTLAMGAENAVFQRDSDVVIGLTYMTGTLVKIGQKLAMACLGEEGLGWVPYLLLWLGLICGGGVGAVLFNVMGLTSLWIVAGWAAILSLYAAIEKRSLA